MVNLVGFQMAQHSGYSGYFQLARYLDAEIIDGNAGCWITDTMPASIRRAVIKRSAMDWYGQADFAAECTAMLRMLGSKKDIFHFVYADNSFCYSARFSGFRKNKLVATYHLPPEIFSRYVRRTDHIKKLDAIICVASYQKDFFAGFLPPERIAFIPHGIDTDFFKPASRAEKEKKTCLFVGSMQRDFQTMAEVARIVSANDKTVKFIVVNRKPHSEYFKSIDNITLKTDLSDSELLAHYQETDVFIQPMKHCTANNSILEAFACGLPVIATATGGVRDYLDEGCAVLVPQGRADLMARELLELLASDQRLQKLSINARKKALEFSWPNIAKRLEEFYAKL